MSLSQKEQKYFRKSYIQRLMKHKNKDYIKVITGIRRAGKSELLKQFQQELIKEGVLENEIVHLNFEDLANERFLDYRLLHEYILDKTQDDSQYYLFLDEIQLVEDFQKVINSLNLRENLDLYITGSNAHIFSGELSTLIAGRYVEIPVFPFSFKEFYDFLGGDKKESFQLYLEKGGLPYAIKIDDEQTYLDYVNGVVSTILIKDIMSRRKLTDSLLLESISKFLFSNIGNLITIKKISDTLTSQNRKTTSPTVESYVSGLLDSLIIHKVDRYDIWGKKYLQINSKFYVSDLAFKNVYLGKRRVNLGHDLENIVYLELLRRGYDVFIGNLHAQEIDFVAQKGDEKLYIQVAATVLDPATFEREIRPLKKLTMDNFPKLLLTLDDYSLGEDGINQVNVIDWLLDIK
ncbi:MAG: ATP-binding protein [Streptococcaceae bacterium]|jgi:predicted AAA+ superfamily ATPase|nr:ATP-binding protein [Streptococcaceae bacterium]